MGVPEQYGIDPCLPGPYFKHPRSALDPAGISVHQQQLLSLTFNEQLPRRSRPVVAISCNVYDPDVQRMGKDFGIFSAIAEMKQGIDVSGHVAGLQGQGGITVAVGHNKDSHGVTVADSVF